MKLGFLTAPFPETPLMEVADWAAAVDFEVLRSPAGHAPAARPASTPAPSPHRCGRSLRRASRRDQGGDRRQGPGDPPGLGFYPNPLHPDPEARAAAIEHLKSVIVGHRQDGPASDQHVLRRRREQERRPELGGGAQGLADIVRFAQDHGVKTSTFENCPMIFSYDEWPAGHHIAYSPTSGGASSRSGVARSA